MEVKELSIEEKARRYDEAIEGIQEILSSGQDYIKMSRLQLRLQGIFPELKESEDDEIRKSIIGFLMTISSLKDEKTVSNKDFDTKAILEWIAWLEKQGEQDNNEDSNILQRFSFYSYKDEPNILYLSGLYVNEECRNKGIGTKILEVADEVAKSLNCHAIRLKTKKDSNAERLYRTHGYNSLTIEESDEIWLEKQGEQKIAEWSEDDEQYLLVCKNALAEYQVSNKWDARIISHWLENKLEVSRNRWRPSDEHIDRLIWVINRLPNTKRAKETKAVIEDLIEQLKKLRMKGGMK